MNGCFNTSTDDSAIADDLARGKTTPDPTPGARGRETALLFAFLLLSVDDGHAATATFFSSGRSLCSRPLLEKRG